MDTSVSSKNSTAQVSRREQIMTSAARLGVDNPMLVHKILLTENSPSELGNVFGNKAPNVEFHEFQSALSSNHQQSPLPLPQTTNDIDTESAAFTIKRAFRDHVFRSIQQVESGLDNSNIDSNISRKDWRPLENLLIDLHDHIRSLVPNRPDLHGILKAPSAFSKDEGAAQSTDDNDTNWIELILEAAKALAQLESEVRSRTTIHLIQYLERGQTNQRSNPSSDSSKVETWIDSILYLIDKAEICAREKESFYITNIVAPKLFINEEGLILERKFFLDRYSTERPPETMQWIDAMIRSMDRRNRDVLQHSHIERNLFIINGWIETILFESKNQIRLPEIFWLDLEELRSIRKVTQTAVAGCALGWHGSQAVGIAISEPSLQEEHKSASLVAAMKSRTKYQTIEAYEEYVCDTLLSVVQGWNDGLELSSATVDTLRGQTRAVLRGQDPVLKLLDSRMKKNFLKVARQVLFDEGNVPTTIRTGLTTRTTSGNTTSNNPLRIERNVIGYELGKSGFAFFKKDLSDAFDQSLRIGRLACRLYDTVFLEEMILNATKAFIDQS